MKFIKDGDALLYMKVGTHAKEELSTIIERKKQELDEAGYAMWGYGGNTCHPTTMVQPFVRDHIVISRPILLVMEPMLSSHLAEPDRAVEFSPDGISWTPVPMAINVLGSRFALCIQTLEEVKEQLDLGCTKVAIGNSQGRNGADYVSGRVDKACLEYSESSGSDSDVRTIGLVAELTEPYAVFLR